MPTKHPTIPFIKGFDVKPSRTTGLGTIVFTDGTDEVVPNQLQCEVYGYTYDRPSGTCRAFTYNTNLNTSFNNLSNKIRGVGNTCQTGTNNTYIMGESNAVRTISRNNIITGSNNEITNNASIPEATINNVSISGTLGEATVSNSIVLGGNSGGDSLGERQFVRCIYGIQTTNNSTVASRLNNEEGVRFAIPDNTIVYFHADTVVVRTGGVAVAGAVGDYGSYVERGVIINKSGTTTIQRERDTIKTSGTVTNWRILASVGADNTLSLTCRGQTDMTLEWCMNVNITQIKTGVAL
tara:strand:+ start:4850 stop:5734 length:885 start_codon:yes stop_codon:yes gene_type:complete